MRVSTGGFTQEARYEADRANHTIALMDVEDFAKAILEYYDKMDIDTRTLLPLRRSIGRQTLLDISCSAA